MCCLEGASGTFRAICNCLLSMSNGCLVLGVVLLTFISLFDC